VQNRDAPAYQEYAANIMAKVEYRSMSLAERGLLYTLRHECWVNDVMPADPARLAKVLGYAVAEIEQCLLAVSAFFVEAEGFISSPDLDSYKTHLADRQKRMSEGGRNGGLKSAKNRGGKQP